jgi:hypothetical protein
MSIVIFILHLCPLAWLILSLLWMQAFPLISNLIDRNFSHVLYNRVHHHTFIKVFVYLLPQEIYRQKP